MPDEMWTALGELATATGRTRSAVVRAAVQRELADPKRPGPE